MFHKMFFFYIHGKRVEFPIAELRIRFFKYRKKIIIIKSTGGRKKNESKILISYAKKSLGG